MESGLKLASCPFCGGESEIIIDTDDDGRFAAVACPKCGAGSRKHYFCGDDARDYAASAWNTRAPSDAALVEALEPFARAYERWADGGNLKGWQAERMKQSVDAHRYCVAFEALAAAKGQQP